MNRQDTANRNRELMPNVAALVDEVREFFPNARVVYAEDLETGQSVGKKPEPPARAWEIPDGYRPSRPDRYKAQKRN